MSWRKFVTLVSVLAALTTIITFFWGTIWPWMVHSAHLVKEWATALARLNALQERVEELEARVQQLEQVCPAPPEPGPDPGSESSSGPKPGSKPGGAGVEGIAMTLRFAFAGLFLTLVLFALQSNGPQ